MPIEQINNSSGVVTYLHHDQAGSTRLITGSTGTVTGKCTYGAYGTPTCEGTATTPLGWDGQYTSADTGLIYMRARVYDPTTAQFVTRDPLEMYTREPYGYAGDNPLNYGDPRGLAGESIGEVPSCPPGICFPFPNTKETERAIEAAKELGHQIGHGIESVWNEVTGEGESSNESTQTLASSECGEAYNGDQDALIKLAKEAKRNDDTLIHIDLKDKDILITGSTVALRRLASELQLFVESDDLNDPGMHTHFDPGQSMSMSRKDILVAADSVPLMVAGPVY